jgi:nitroreductase
MKIKQRLISISTRFKKGASFYYLRNHQFNREQQAVLYGKLMYENDISKQRGNEFLLRRNTHRLEKGLIMKDRREIFAREYIRETVQNYKQCIESANISKESLEWCHDVLCKYFSVVGDDPIVNQAKDIFHSFDNQKNAIKIPYKLKKQNQVSFEQFYQLTIQRRSVRWFDNRPVPREITQKALKAALNSPSACNRQPFKFYIFDKPEMAQKIGGIPMGTKGFSQNFPAVAVIVGELRAYPFERDRHVIYIDGSLAAMSFMFALESLGLSSCPINWPDVEKLEQKMEKALDLEKDQRPIMLIAYGYADKEGEIPYSAKKTPEQIAIYNLDNDF